MACRHAISDHQREQVGAADSKNASDRSTDEASQTNPPQPPFEEHDAEPYQGAHSGIQLAGESERFDYIRGNCNHQNEKKTYKN